MQSSSSFSSSRSGRPRPANLSGVDGLSRSSSANTLGGGSESLPWPSPSFNVEHATSISPPQTGRKEVFADPGRPSSSFVNGGDQASYFKLCAPVGSLPPTPLTASNQLPPEFSEKESDGINLKKSMISVGGDKLSPTLPPSNDSPSTSNGSGSTLPRLSEMLASAALASPTIGSSSEHHHQEPLPFNSAPPRLVRSSSGRFEGPRASWTQGGIDDNNSRNNNNDLPVSVGVHFAPRMRTTELPDVPQDAYMRTPQPDSMIPSSWNPASSSSSSSVMGLGLQLDATPRASDCMGVRREYSFRIPGASPSAPSLQPIEQGVFPTFPATLSSPSLDSPSTGNWNTNLRFPDEGMKEQEMDKEVREPASEKELRQIEVMEGEMPRGGAGGGLVGLGIFMDGKLPEPRARNDPSSSQVELYGEEERASAAHTMASLALMGVATPPVATSSTPNTASINSSSRPTPKRPQSHVNLKPHVHKMRLGASASASKSKKASTSEESGRDKGKRRSEALVRQVTSTTASSSEKKTQRQVSPTVSPRKRALELEPEMELEHCEDEDGEEMDLPIQEIQVKVSGSVAMQRENQVALFDSSNGSRSSSSTPNISRTSSPAPNQSPFGVLKLGKKNNGKIRSTTSKASLLAQAQVGSSAMQSSFQLPSKQQSSSQLPSLSSEPQVWRPLVPGSMTSKAEKEKRASIKKQKRAASEGSKEKERPQLNINVKNFDSPLSSNSTSSATVPRKALGVKSHNVATPKLGSQAAFKGHSISSSEGSSRSSEKV